MKLNIALIAAATVGNVVGRPGEKEDVFAIENPSAFFNGPNTERRYKDLHAITLHYNPTFDHRKFWYYGCHCLMLSDRAMSTRGVGKPVDELDALCKLYKECVHCAKKEFGSECIPEAVKYDWKVTKGKVMSKNNPPGTCKRALFECDHMYAKKLQKSNAMETFTTDYHGYWTTTGFDYKNGGCPKRGGQSQPECCGGYDKPFFLYNTLNLNLQCCPDGTVAKVCAAE